MALAKINGRGFIIADPEFKYLQNGNPVVNFPVAFNKRKKNQDTGEWEDDKGAVIRATAWGDLAEFINDKFESHTEIDISGDFHTRQYETKDGERRLSVEMIVTAVGGPIPKRDSNGGGFGQNQGSEPWGNTPDNEGY